MTVHVVDNRFAPDGPVNLNKNQPVMIDCQFFLIFCMTSLTLSIESYILMECSLGRCNLISTAGLERVTRFGTDL